MNRPETEFEAKAPLAKVDYATFSIRIAEKWRDEIDFIAEKKDTTRNDIISQMLDWCIADQMKKLGEARK